MVGHPYRRPAERHEDEPSEAGERDLPFGDLAIGIPLVVVGVLGIVGGVVFPRCTLEAGLGTVMLAIGAQTIALDVRRRRRCGRGRS